MRTTTSKTLLAFAALCPLVMSACKLTSVTLGSDTGSAGSGGSSSGSGGSAPSYRIGTAEECPADLSDLESSACDLPSDVACVQQVNAGWIACTCGCYHVGKWACFSEGGGPACPLAQPANQSACAGYEGALCPYFPSTMCKCSTTTHAWSCGPEPAEIAVDWQCLSPPPSSSDPPGIDPSKTIAALTDAEAHAWCAWFVTSVYTEGGAAPPPDGVVAADGTVDSYAFTSCGDSPAVCIERLSIDHCVASLKLGACTATVEQLDDCMHTMVNLCQVVGEGCDAYMAQTSCNQTMVAVTTSFGCKIKVQ